MIKIFKREYDNPVFVTGKEKPNELLGEFEIVQTFDINDLDTSKKIAIRKDDGSNDVYLIEQFQVGFPALSGSRFVATKLINLQVKENYLKKTTSIPQYQWGVHESHCCIEHGCKYGDVDCPVVLKLIKQTKGCEDCE